MFPLPPDATEKECRDALAHLPEHLHTTHLFEPPTTQPYPHPIGAAQFLAAVLGAMAIRYHDDPTFRISQGIYRTHSGDTSTRAAPCYLLEIVTQDNTLATCVVNADRRGGQLLITMGKVCRARSNWWRAMKLWGPVVLFFCICIGIPAAFFLLHQIWKTGGVEPSSDNRPMPADGEHFIRQVALTIGSVLQYSPANTLRQAADETSQNLDELVEQARLTRP